VSTIRERLSRDRLLALAVRAHPPLRLAETFASYAGQFYDRTAFDLLARETAARYAVRDADQAAAFRRRLDARLEQRERGAVNWSPPGATTTPPA
jgi:hypothetical protein